MAKSINRYKQLKLIICLVIMVQTAFSQANSPVEFDMKNMFPTSPEAAMLGRFGDIPVGYYTGTPDISVPLYDIKENNVDIPIVLRYNGSGIKVADQATWVGLGWSLQPGGAIIQIVNGTEDTFDKLVTIDPTGYAYLKEHAITGVYTERNETGTDVPPCPSPDIPGDSYTTFERLLQGDGQPDIYEYNFLGYSGKFYINPETNNVVLLDKSASINIVRTSNGWAVTTLDGNRFYFTAEETVFTDYLQNYVLATWKLTSIDLTNGQVITFTYNNGYYATYSYYETFHSPYPFDLGSVSDMSGEVVPHSDFTWHNINYLTKITTDNATIVFNLEDRQDMFCESDSDGISNDGVLSAKRLKSIDIISNLTSKKIKSFNFKYDYFPYSTVGGDFSNQNGSIDSPAYLDTLGKRLRLDSLQEIGYTNAGDSITEPPYRFYYDTSTLLPLKTSYAQDFWGYYNGLSNTKLIPDLSYYFYSGDPLYQYMPISLLSYFQGANRNVDTTRLTADILNKMVYPTGGYTEFNYSSNTFGNHAYPDLQQIDSCTKQVALLDENMSVNQTSITFSLPRTETIQFTNTISRGPDFSLPYDSLLPATITLEKIALNGNITVLKVWQMQNDQQDLDTFNARGGGFQWVDNYTFNYDSTAKYSVVVNLPDDLGPQGSDNRDASVRSNFIYYSLPKGNFNTSYGGGVRISNIRNYTAIGNLVHRQDFSYFNTDSTSPGILMSPLTFLYPRKMYFVNTILTDSGTVGTFQEAIDTTWFISSEGYIPYSDAAKGTVVGYSRVAVMNTSSNGSNNGKQIFYYNNQASQTKLNNPDIPNLLNGTLSRKIILNSSGDTLLTTNYYYQDIDTSLISFTGVKLYTNYYGNKPCSFSAPTVNGVVIDSLPPVGGLYEVDYYPLNSAWYKLQQTYTQQYSEGQKLTSSVNYTYNSMGQPIRTDSYNSKHQLVSSQYIFPADTSGSQASLLESYGLYNDLIERRDLLNNTEIAKTIIGYGSQNGHGVETSIEKSYQNQIPFTDLYFNTYGPYNNLLQYAEKSKTSSLIWSDNNTYVIASTNNASQSDIAYTSFEADGKGNWTFIGTPTSAEGGITGTMSYSLASGAISKSGLTSSTKYIVSYWLYSGGSVSIRGGTQSSNITGYTTRGWTYHEVTFTSTTSISLSGSGYIDELRLYPVDAQMTTYTYQPLIGVTSQCSPDNKIQYYDYDGLGRLQDVKNEDGNIIILLKG